MARADGRFDGEYADTLRELDENGVAVIPGVMSADQCDIHIAELHHWIDGFQGGFPDQFSSIIHKSVVSEKYRVKKKDLNFGAKLQTIEVWKTKVMSIFATFTKAWERMCITMYYISVFSDILT
ncbi:hypothetical protein CAPTEDRAFT_208785 [Capitella teleta]|uniref:Uncharacterized protein n=1 Tax=Capitella teleta TaxID=283909 RepID=R7T7L6_CAPTE|nr:hypothetical protein CAPTEDRAFT_208785 [Capitella teleta]|eukprot:ELT89418.1 hypothetical protein CAPTEDRAFT_208785 [Capitella teleta]